LLSEEAVDRATCEYDCCIAGLDEEPGALAVISEAWSDGNLLPLNVGVAFRLLISGVWDGDVGRGLLVTLRLRSRESPA